MSGNNYLLVDAKNLLWRAASVMLALSNGKVATGGLHGFLKSLLKVHREHGGHVIICWDDHKKPCAVRKKAFPGYKRREPNPEREKIHEEVIGQMGTLRSLLQVLGVQQCRAPMWEADDVMATLARRYAKEGGHVVIYTGDRDLWQCVGPAVTVLRPHLSHLIPYDAARVQKEWGVYPEQVPDYKALTGDDSDNIPGCKGIGPVAAQAILKAFPTVEEALEAATSPKWAKKGLAPRIAMKLKEGENDVIVSKSLATVNPEAKLVWLRPAQDERAAKRMLLSLKLMQVYSQFDALKALAWDRKH